MTRRDTIAETILASRVLLSRYLVGFDDSNHTRQAPGLPNHVAWILGHCALTMHRAAERIDDRPLPDSDFVASQPEPARPSSPAGSAKLATPMRFSIDTIAFQSRPVDQPSLYPRLTRCAEVFNHACIAYAQLIRTLPEHRLDEMVQWGAIEIPIWTTALRLAFHNGSHCGQIVDLRRALGMRGIFA
jgi:hypothetical protein